MCDVGGFVWTKQHRGVLRWGRPEGMATLAAVLGLLVGSGTGACGGRDCGSASCQSGVKVAWSAKDYPDTHAIRLCGDDECNSPEPPINNPDEPADGRRTKFLSWTTDQVNVRLEFLDPSGAVTAAIEGPAALSKESCCLGAALRVDDGRLVSD